MTLELKIINLIEELLKIRDASVIEKLEETLKEEKIKAYESKLKPMTKEKLIKRALESEKDIKDGNVTDVEDLLDEFE